MSKWPTTTLALALAALPGGAYAQLNVQWAGFQNETATRLQGPDPSVGVNDTQEKDYAWGDVDNDGDIDLVSVRKQPYTSPGRRTNVLFINEDGVLVDETAQYATDNDVLPPGTDQGFLTPTNDRDVVLADLNGDGWLDIATAVTISDGLPKPVSHPRIYINKGAPGGSWLGFRFEQGRSPQLYVLNANGTPNMSAPNPGRFCSIAAGDVDDDGDIDLFLGDYDSSGSGGSGEPPGIDINDRLWINDGNGFFSDSYQTRMSAGMLLSAFSAAAAIADMNGDGLNDVVKDTALNAPQYVGIAYNRGPDPVAFDLFDTPHTFAPYFVSVGDLNNDSRLDMVVTDDDQDRYDLNTGNDALGRALFPASRTFSFPSQAQYDDDGFGSQSLIADLDNDGWKDVLISDIDVDIDEGCVNRLHIYHNLGNAPNVTLREEAQLAGAGSGWKGAVGLGYNDLSGTFHTAVFDLDGDGDEDLVLGRCSGTSVWTNTLNPCPIVKYGTASPNSTGQVARVASYGSGDLSNRKLIFNVTNLPPLTTGHFVYTRAKKTPCTAFGDGQLCLLRRTRVLPSLPDVTADKDGHARVVVDFDDAPFAGAQAGEKRYLQFLYADPAGGPAGFNLSEAVDVSVCP